MKLHRAHAGTVARTMAYFDGVSLARRANAPTLFSVGLMDRICPPSTGYAAFNHYGAEGEVDQADKHIRAYPFNDHEGGGPTHEVVKLEWLAKQLNSAA